MSLREYQQQQSGTMERAQRQGTTWFEPYRQPLQGVVTIGGQEVPVLVLQIGDQPGSSDVYKCIGVDGAPATVRERDLRITGISSSSVGAYLPVETALGMNSQQRFSRNLGPQFASQ
jgi:hypothetical protein